MNRPILYSYRRCPFAMRARLALWAAAIDCEVREISLQDKPPLFLQTSPKGTVPVLVLGDQVIDESLDIVFWALQQNDPYGWLQDGLKAKIEEAMEVFVPCVYRYKYPDRYASGDVKHAVEQGWQWLEQHAHLLQQKHDELTALDVWQIALFPFIRQWYFVAQEMGDDRLASGAQWVRSIEQLPCFKAVMLVHPTWHQLGDPVGQLRAC